MSGGWDGFCTVSLSLNNDRFVASRSRFNAFENINCLSTACMCPLLKIFYPHVVKSIYETLVLLKLYNIFQVAK